VANTCLDVLDIVRLKVAGMWGTRRIHNTYTHKSGTVPERSAAFHTFLLLGLMLICFNRHDDLYSALSRRPELLLDPPSLLSDRHQGIKRPERKADQLQRI
jgi:hypothetical protein